MFQHGSGSGLHRFAAGVVMLGLVCGLALGAPFDLWDTANPVVLDTPLFEQGSGDDHGETLDDVIGSPFDADTIYVSKATYSMSLGTDDATDGNTNDNTAPGVLQYTLTRDGSGAITGATADYQVLNTLPTTSSYAHNGKALDIYDTDTIYVAAEEGGSDATSDSDGTVDMLSLSTATFSVGADLTGVRSDTGSQYDPEGLAVDRDNDFLYVVTDDATDQSVAQYSIGAAGALTLNWSAAVATGVSNGNDAIILPDGRVAVLTGSGGSTHVYAVSQDGLTVTDLLGGAIALNEGPQDMLVVDGILYVADEDGTILAFDLGSPSTTALASLDLNSLGLANEILIGGISVTADNELIVSTRFSGGSVGEVLAFNLAGGSGTTVIPEPATLLLLGLGLGGVYWRRRRG